MDNQDNEKKSVRLIQMLYDDVFLMLLLGVVVPFILYTVWGLIELLAVPLSE